MSRDDRELAKRFWSGTSLRALAPLLLAIFFTFATIGFLMDVANACRTQPRVLAVVVAFSGWFFMTFIVRQGLRRVRAEAEMALAREIHVSLVPDVSLETADCEMFGRSIPAPKWAATSSTRSSWQAARSASWPTSRATECRPAP